MLADRALSAAEDLVYGGVALILVTGAGGLLVTAARDLPHVVGRRETGGMVAVLDTLLLVFILVELLYGVRQTLRERQVLVEPFLLVGMLAAIKEIVVLSVEAAEQVIADGEAFERSVVQIAVLGLLVVALSASAVLLRRKEREPPES
jgi:uncharacterized membrane protein (DUF373 family)